MGYWSAVPLQLGAESERAPCPAPVPPVCHRSIPNICLFFSSPMQASPPPQQKDLGGPVLDGPGAFSFWSGPLHTCTNVFVCLSCILPHFVPCLLTAHFFFPAIPHPTVPLLGSGGRFNPYFWAIHSLPFEGPTPLSSPKHPSVTFPPPKPCVSCLLPSLCTTFAFLTPPFATSPLLLLRPLPTAVSFPALYSLASPPQ